MVKMVKMVPLAVIEPATHPNLGCTLSCYKHESLPLSYSGVGEIGGPYWILTNDLTIMSRWL